MTTIQIPQAVMREVSLSPSARLLYGVLVEASTDGRCSLTQQQLAERIGVTRSTVKVVLQQLADAGFLRVERLHGTALIYWPIEPAAEVSA